MLLSEKPPLRSQSSPNHTAATRPARAERLLAERERLSRMSAEMSPAEFRATALATLQQVETLDAELDEARRGGAEPSALDAARHVLGFR